ncbi:MAG TPA: glycerol-3-phosphate 1-O-acyltransferase PlsY [Rhodothermales bacterium]|nr:glycerol-3-phosphate 1-O-acyltransferase PlsY [Rhodothermales bacterium]HRR07739.1 glycerol-3-phosphate 1-O-acyltransferase PlsY [Rhodothermales bacterium]
MLSLVIILSLSYLVGSIPTSIVISKLLKGIDIREHGSGNAGGTNTYRILGRNAALIVVVVDVMKGLVAALFISQIRIGGEALPISEKYHAVMYMAGLAAVIGHIWTIFAGFRGGKGVATGMGMVLGTLPGGILIGLPVFILIVSITGYVSLSSILSALAIPFAFVIMDETGLYNFSPVAIWFTIGLSALIVFAHRANIKRLMAGSENSFKKKN